MVLYPESYVELNASHAAIPNAAQKKNCSPFQRGKNFVTMLPSENQTSARILTVFHLLQSPNIPLTIFLHFPTLNLVRVYQKEVQTLP